MRGGMELDEGRAALERAAREMWGDERASVLGPAIERVSRAIWLVCQEPLEPRSEEPDLASPVPVIPERE